MGEMRNVNKILVEKSEGKRPLRRLGADGVMNPVHTLQPYFLTIHFNIILPSSQLHVGPGLLYNHTRCTHEVYTILLQANIAHEAKGIGMKTTRI
jgi:hypothetical protein